jgi:hypothetical protein
MPRMRAPASVSAMDPMVMASTKRPVLRRTVKACGDGGLMANPAAQADDGLDSSGKGCGCG